MKSFSDFEWDDNKRRANVAKHGLDFVDATEVFADPRQHTYRSPHQSGEERFVSIGNVRGRLIAVVFTQRGNKLRIISARPVRRNEREQYDS
ncbi:MAG: BrnT family toxin [Rhizobiales bacterium]|nr:BrnT family toxin [Hyphomicrobiales bacterium]